MKDKILFIILFICLASFGQGKKKLIASYQQANSAPTLTPLVRINAGGAEVTATDGFINWAVNTGTSGTGYTSSGGATASTASVTWTRHSSIPSEMPDADFQALYDNRRHTGSSITYNSTLSNGNYTVRIFLGAQETANFSRTDITIEGVLVQDGFQPEFAWGYQTAGMLSYNVTLSDGSMTIVLSRDGTPVNNSAVYAVEISQ